MIKKVITSLYLYTKHNFNKEKRSFVVHWNLNI